MEFGKRIKKMIIHLGISQNEFGRKIGVSGTVISHWVTERNEPMISKIVEILNEFPEFSTVWLVQGKGPMLEAEIGNNTTAYDENINDRFKIIEQKIEELLRERNSKKDNDK